MTDIATNLAAFIIVLGFLIFTHEAGHFVFAKLFRVRVLVFSFGFGKRLFGFRRGETDYRVSMIPLGGYVRMAGENPEEKTGADPGEFLTKPKWQRFLILLAGPGVNLIIAVVFLAWMNMIGILMPRNSLPILGSVLPGKPAAAAGLQAGDVILEANGERITTFDDLRLVIGMNPGIAVRLEYQRGAAVRKTTIVPERQVTDYGVTGVAGVMAFVEPEVGRVLPDSAAGRAGLREGDRILSIGGKPVTQMTQFITALDPKGAKPASFEVRRGAQTIALTLPPKSPSEEIYPGFGQPLVLRKLGLGAALRESVSQNIKMVKYTFIVIGRLVRAQGSVKDFSGPLSIARISGEMLRTGWRQLVVLMATISLQLGIMNLLPIPVLDGGHIMILVLEGFFRRELSLKVKERIQQIGFAALATLMIFVLYHDVLSNVMRLRNG